MTNILRSRFCPSFFLYLLGVVPAIWFLELDRLNNQRRAENGTAVPVNATAQKLSASIKGVSQTAALKYVVVLLIERKIMYA